MLRRTAALNRAGAGTTLPVPEAEPGLGAVFNGSEGLKPLISQETSC